VNLFIAYLCWTCGVLAHIFYLRLRGELEGRWTCPRCGVRTVRGERRKMADHWYCESCAGMYWPTGGEKS